MPFSKCIFIIFYHYTLFNGLALSQENSTQPTIKKPEFFTSGFIDVQNNGQMSASTRLFKLYIGEPKKFSIPVSIYSGVTNNSPPNIQNSRALEPILVNLINPLSGILNISIEKNFASRTKEKRGVSYFSIINQIGEKILPTSYLVNNKQLNILSGFINIGLMFQTGAWEKSKEKNLGIFWLILRGHIFGTNKSISVITGFPSNKNVFTGWSTGFGIEITSLINIKSFVYKYFDERINSYFYQISLNYSLKN